MQGWPVAQPDIVVSTPAALLNYLLTYDPEMNRRSKFLRSVKSVVIHWFIFTFFHHSLGDDNLTNNIIFLHFAVIYC